MVDDATKRIADAARAMDANALLAAAEADGFGAGSFDSGSALVSALEAEAPTAIAAAVRGLARSGMDGAIDLALALCRSHSRQVRVAAAFALAHSRRDDALDVLCQALEPRSDVPLAALHRSVHPNATARVRAHLDASGVCEFVSRRRPTLTEWLTMSEGEKKALHGAEPPKRRDARFAGVAQAIRCLAVRQAEGAVETIVQLFEQHPDDGVRLACAHALPELSGDERAARAIDRACDDPDGTIATICVRASIQRDLGTAYDRFAPRLEAALAAADEGGAMHPAIAMTSTLLYVLHGGATPRRIPPHKDPLAIDERFSEFAARARHRPDTAKWARRVLQLLPRERLAALLAKFPREARPRGRIVMPERRDWLARYQAGEHDVWAEIVRHAPAIVERADLREEANTVARALMARVRVCVDTVRATLVEAGARLAEEAPPATDAELARLVRVTGCPTPIALDAFWRVVGSIALVPGAEDGGNRYDYGKCALEEEGIALLALDPLELRGPDVTWELDEYEERVAASHVEVVGPLRISMAPDFLHKQDISGGPPYEIELPAPSEAEQVDPRVLHEAHGTTLVGYLRAAFAQGGFPMLEVAACDPASVGLNERIAFRQVKGSWGTAGSRLRERLCTGLIPF